MLQEELHCDCCCDTVPRELSENVKPGRLVDSGALYRKEPLSVLIIHFSFKAGKSILLLQL